MLIKRKLIKSDIEFYRDVQDINDPCTGCCWYESVGYGYACNNYSSGQWKTIGEICREIYGKFDNGIDGCYSYFPENERK